MISPDKIFISADSILEFAPRTLHYSYQLFINYFREDELSHDKILSGAYMVYGWMPTMLRLKGPRESVVELAHAGKLGTVSPQLLEQCAKTLNNSLVGTTKLLHFISPDKYPIWDSRVYRALFGEHPYPYRVEDTSAYMDFLDWCCEFEKLLGFARLKSRFELESGYPVTNKRVCEAVLYALGAKPKKTKKVP
jgi:hypothetical protein